MSQIINEKIVKMLSDKDAERRRQGSFDIEQKVRILGQEKKKNV
jgi:hypothetical protein